MKSLSVTIQMKAIVMMFITLYVVVLWMKSFSENIQIKAVEEYFLASLFVFSSIYL